MKGSVHYVLKFVLPPFSPPLPYEVQISKQTDTEPSIPEYFFAGVDVDLFVHFKSQLL